MRLGLGLVAHKLASLHKLAPHLLHLLSFLFLFVYFFVLSGLLLMGERRRGVGRVVGGAVVRLALGWLFGLLLLVGSSTFLVALAFSLSLRMRSSNDTSPMLF